MSVYTITYNHDQNSKTVFADTPKEIYSAVGKLLISEIDRSNLPTYIDVENNESDASTARFKVVKRGTYIKDGVKVPSLYTTCEWDYLGFGFSDFVDDFAYKYLVCVNPESNNYKFYEFQFDGLNKISANYGRISPDGEGLFGTRSTSFDFNMFWIRYYEKLSKGYKDMTDIHNTFSYNKDQNANTTLEDDSTDTAPTDNKDANNLFGRLYASANGYYVSATATKDEKALLCDYKPSEKEVELAEHLVQNLYKATTVENFNDNLEQLLVLVPRHIDENNEYASHNHVDRNVVDDLLAHDTSDFSYIIDRERSLLDAMKGIAHVRTNANGEMADNFKNHGVKVRKATEKQTADVLNRLEPSQRSEVVNVYRIIDKDKEKQYNDYRKAHHIKHTRKYWHGSRNETWLSIINDGLSLKYSGSNAGTMFGNGLYFAPSSDKSMLYTSRSGSYWSHGDSDTYFLGLYATAQGKAYRPTNTYDVDATTMQNYDSVYADHKQTGLRRDEVVFYDDNAVLLEYLVEFKTGA